MLNLRHVSKEKLFLRKVDCKGEGQAVVPKDQYQSTALCVCWRKLEIADDVGVGVLLWMCESGAYFSVYTTLQRKSHFCRKRNCVSEGIIYIFPGSVHLFFCSRIGRPILGKYKSLIDTWMWKLGLRLLNSFAGNTYLFRTFGIVSLQCTIKYINEPSL